MQWIIAQNEPRFILADFPFFSENLWRTRKIMIFWYENTDINVDTVKHKNVEHKNVINTIKRHTKNIDVEVLHIIKTQIHTKNEKKHINVIKTQKCRLHKCHIQKCRLTHKKHINVEVSHVIKTHINVIIKHIHFTVMHALYCTYVYMS